MHGLIERIYEAAFQPECWQQVLQEAGELVQSPAGIIFIFDELRPIQHKATPSVVEVAHLSAENWQDSPRVTYVQKRPLFGFTVLNSYFPPELMAFDPCRRHLKERDFDSEIAAAFPLPTGEMIVYDFVKRSSEGSHVEADVATLNTLLPHLARAGLMAAQIGLERARATTATLQSIGLPAAVLTSSGRVLSTNALFESLTNLFMPVAFGRLAVADIGANRLLQEAIEIGMFATERVRSIPVGEKEDREACVLHIFPLRRSAHDLFPGGDLVVAVSALRKSLLVPSPQVLMGLFDLTPAETRFAIGLTSGASLRDVSQSLGLTESSGRTYLARIFEKTGTHRQAELITLLSSTQAF